MDRLPDAVQRLVEGLSRYASPENHIHVESDRTFSLYTSVNRYRISYTLPGTDDSAPPSLGYLGCIAESRTPRPGESWCRGNDLADGPFSEETWHRILADIVAYEMVRIARRQQQALE